MKMMNGTMKASWAKSLGDVRSHTRYHFVKGTCPGAATPGASDGAKEGTPGIEESAMEAGPGSGAAAKSAKSGHASRRGGQHLDILRAIVNLRSRSPASQGNSK